MTQELNLLCQHWRLPTYHRRPQIMFKNGTDASRRITVNTDGEEETGKSRMERGHLVTDKGVIWSLQSQRTLNLKLTRLLSCGLESVSSFRLHARCIASNTRDFPDLKINTSQQLFLRLLTTLACGRKAGFMNSLANREEGLSALDAICSSHIRDQVS